jgi:adenylosuccinate lyase
VSRGEREHLKDDRFGYTDFLSPFTWRYGSKEMRTVFSEKERRATWRRIWAELAKAEQQYGLLSKTELRDILSKSGREYVDIRRAHEIERTIKHDLMAEVHVFAQQAKKGGGKLHLGATSMDIEDNADILLFRRGADLVLDRLVNCLDAATEQALRYKNQVCIGWTHLQPAEPTTLGYRLASYAQDIAMDVHLIEFVITEHLKGKGMKGAVGTSASYRKLLGSERKTARLEERIMKNLGIERFYVSSQTYPRKVYYLLLSCLASIAQSCHKFGLDLRILQSPSIGELSEPISAKQVGSSAMPFKKNPTAAERMCSLARYVAALPGVAFMNASISILERTLDDSASRRLAIPEAFIAIDECLSIYEKLMRGLTVYPLMMRKNLEKFGEFAGTEALLMEMVERGEDRQAMHELIRKHSFAAWETVMRGERNPLARLLSDDPKVSSEFTRREVFELLKPQKHVGNAREFTLAFISNVARPILRRHRARVGKSSRVEY